MSAHLELPPNLLDTRRPLGLRVDGETRSTILQLAQLADRGECIEAAQQAVVLLRADVYDLRLACVYLVGLFVERGVAYLPELLRSAGRLVANEAAAPPPVRCTPRVLDTTLQWLFQNLRTHIQFHARQRDDTWTQWLRDGAPTLPDELGDELEQLTRAVGEAVEQPVSTGALAWIARWARGDLARARSRVAEKDAAERATAEATATPEPQPQRPDEPPEGRPYEPETGFDDDDLHEPDDDGFDDNETGFDDNETGFDEPDDGLHEPDFFGSYHEPEPQRNEPQRNEPESPALNSLRRKIDGFQRLVERGDFAKAAFVARDVQRIIERFDPVEFLPTLFAGYFRVMSQRLDELRPHLDEADDTPWQVLTRFYQADLAGFLED